MWAPFVILLVNRVLSRVGGGEVIFIHVHMLYVYTIFLSFGRCQTSEFHGFEKIDRKRKVKKQVMGSKSEKDLIKICFIVLIDS